MICHCGHRLEDHRDVEVEVGFMYPICTECGCETFEAD